MFMSWNVFMFRFHVHIKKIFNEIKYGKQQWNRVNVRIKYFVFMVELIVFINVCMVCIHYNSYSNVYIFILYKTVLHSEKVADTSHTSEL